uniref:Uncharacterized protein n=1 Tax=Pithovirus LCPAC304 TaxID=2506594 RepID=A0A481ZB73_9VIRU|nr:MAG: hypothetical protein LCPAC304_06760 [Pithovirus LCPAC304]
MGNESTKEYTIKSPEEREKSNKMKLAKKKQNRGNLRLVKDGLKDGFSTKQKYSCNKFAVRVHSEHYCGMTPEIRKYVNVWANARNYRVKECRNYNNPGGNGYYFKFKVQKK